MVEPQVQTRVLAKRGYVKVISLRDIERLYSS